MQNKAINTLVTDFFHTLNRDVDRVIRYIVVGFYIFGLLLIFYYDTWAFGLGIGTLNLLLYLVASYGIKSELVKRQMISLVFAIFMLQFIGQMHGMYEMHFFFFINIAILIIYQDWRVMIPYTIFAIAHHSVFFYFQINGYGDFREYFINIDNITFSVLFFHFGLAIAMAAICGWWAKILQTNAEEKAETLRIMEIQNEELQASEEALSTINTQLVEQQQALEHAIKDLENKNFELDQIVYKTSHDLRSPLTSILGIIELIRMEPEKLEEYLHYIETRTRKLDNFVISMLNYGKAVRKEAVIEGIDFHQLVDECISDLQYKPGFDKLQIVTEIDQATKAEHFISDSFRLKIVFSNLISNAIKYQNFQQEHSLLEINIHVGIHEAHIRLQDNGIGIGEAYLNKIFDMFSRATESGEGSGLGLYIVKQCVDKLKGSIQVESELGEGSSFTIQIPSLGPSE